MIRRAAAEPIPNRQGIILMHLRRVIDSSFAAFCTYLGVVEAR